MYFSARSSISTTGGQHPRLVVASDAAASEISGSDVLLFFQGRATRSATIMISRLGSDHSLTPGLAEAAATVLVALADQSIEVDSSEVDNAMMMIPGQGIQLKA